MQPVQDLTIEDRVSRTQYQFTVEDADAETWQLGTEAGRAPAHAAAARRRRQRPAGPGLQAYVEIDRTPRPARRHAAAIDNALYNAFGQRLISTIFTQSNQYRVVLEVQPEYQKGPAALNDIYVTSTDGQQVRLSAIARVIESTAPLSINHLGQFSGQHDLVQSRARSSLGDAVRSIREAETELGLPASMQTSFQGAALPSKARWTTRC
jgi:multidrug efflux pump